MTDCRNCKCPAGHCAMAAADNAREQAGALLRLRALRLWHWRQLKQARRNAQAAASSTLASRYNAEASTHLGFVQSLNDFFANGDTAEHDDNREDAA